MKKFKIAIRSILEKIPSYKQYEELEIPLDTCVHYTGFRYGLNEYNPLENSALDLYNGLSLIEVRRRFVDFLRYYRPCHLGEALGITLERRCSLWAFPWRVLSDADRSLTFGWHEKPEEIEDIITHYSEKGILSYLIDREFFWQERALRSIMENNYRPKHYSYVRTLELRRKDHSSAHILLDGNHRVSALSAIGAKSLVVLRDKSMVIYESNLEEWPEVRNGIISHIDAQSIFDAYFKGNNCWRTSRKPASIIATPDWENLYLNTNHNHSHPTGKLSMEQKRGLVLS